MVFFAFVTLLVVSAAPLDGGRAGATFPRPRASAVIAAAAPPAARGVDGTAGAPDAPRAGDHRPARDRGRRRSELVRRSKRAGPFAPDRDRGLTFPAPSDAYSARARRRIAAYLRLRILEMRESGLERAAAVVERRLPVDVLVPPLRDGGGP